MTSRMLFIIGAVALAASVYWWADYYTTFLDVTGRRDSTKDWMDAMQVYGQCLFWDTEPCLAAIREPGLAHRTAYRPYGLWLAAGILAAGAIVRIRETWQASGTPPRP